MLYSALGATWALVGLLEIRPVGMPWLAILLGLITGALLILSLRAVRRAGMLAEEDTDQEAAAERARRAARSHLVLRAEGFAITGVTAALFLTDNHGYVAPATALIVGLHFVALAPIHRTLGDAIAGALIVLAAIATIVWVPDIPSVHRNAMNIAAGFGTAAILWACATVMLWMANRDGSPES
jgi:hypothetical protein